MNYYDKHADTYINSTVSVDMGSQYSLFLPYLPKGASILDAGCGSGRDSLHFLEQGYKVEAFDNSSAMVEHARALTGLAVRKLSFAELDYDSTFDGIWACASLLHVPRTELPAVFRLLHRALKPKGLLYCSFKDREADFSQGGRDFSCFTSDSFKLFLSDLTVFELIELKYSQDVREGRGNERWLNILLARK
ncbi:class I SAM-dependent methyltransferase [Sphaerochaeta sp. UBA5849]|jgi:SAM-dependent methyltransferase|uniref:class I SAM-dependent methyltransferase n=1 Tax=Sphaerochaeta sp. UBA5849 TaxID=1947475 RepID=UPI0031F48850